MNDSRHRSSSRRGFTLVEVLVSSFLTLLVMGMLFSVLIGTLDAWQGGTSRLESSGDARLALDILKADLEGMLARRTTYNQEWLSSRSYQDPDSGITNTWLSFFSPSLDRESGQEGDIVAVSYATSYQDPISSNDIAPIFGMYKGMTSTEHTFDTVLDFPPEALLTDYQGSTGYWPGSGGVPDMSYSSNDDVRKNFLVPRVVKFSVAWWIRAPGANQPTRVDETFDVRLANELVVLNSAGTRVLLGGTIEAAEISLTTISEEGMDRFRFFEGTGNPAGNMNRIIQEFGRTQTMRVSIHY